MADAQDEPGIPDKRDAELLRMIRQDKAERAIKAVQDGANPAAEAYRLANEFTDNITDSLAKRVRRWLRRPSKGS